MKNALKSAIIPNANPNLVLVCLARHDPSGQVAADVFPIVAWRVPIPKHDRAGFGFGDGLIDTASPVIFDAPTGTPDDPRVILDRTSGACRVLNLGYFDALDDAVLALWPDMQPSPVVEVLP